MHDRDHRLSLLARVAAILDRAGIPHALIGASAMAAHGVSRSTFDQDLLTVDAASLDAELWSHLILLKLHAGGPQDAWDIEQLLAGPDRPRLIESVEQRLPELPQDSVDLWRRILRAGGF